jgi:uncharacterized protein YcbX
MSELDVGAGRVDGLFRYPVKSMLGERLDASRVDERGFLGDRGYALVDQETGKVASAKNPRLWSRLFECRAEYVVEPGDDPGLPPVRITLPGGAHVLSDDARVHESLSRFIDRPVRLETTAPDGTVIEVLAPTIEGVSGPEAGTIADEAIAIVAPGTFFDAAPLHVVTSATLARLRDLAPGSAFPAARFRPNVVVAVETAPGFVENEWVGHTLGLGEEVSASVFLAAPRCVMTTLAQPDLPRDPVVLQTVARHNRIDIPGLGPSSCVGIYALVTTGGVVSRTDRVDVA